QHGIQAVCLGTVEDLAQFRLLLLDAQPWPRWPVASLRRRYPGRSKLTREPRHHRLCAGPRGDADQREANNEYKPPSVAPASGDERSQSIEQALPDAYRPCLELLVPQDVEHGKPDCARNLIAAERREVLHAIGERLGDLALRDDRAEGMSVA